MQILERSVISVWINDNCPSYSPTMLHPTPPPCNPSADALAMASGSNTIYSRSLLSEKQCHATSPKDLMVTWVQNEVRGRIYSTSSGIKSCQSHQFKIFIIAILMSVFLNQACLLVFLIASACMHLFWPCAASHETHPALPTQGG